jgi:hypothetical protein
MSYSAFRLYVTAYLDKDFYFYVDKYDGTCDAELTIEYIKQAGIQSLKNPVVEEALKEAIRRTPAYKLYIFEKSKDELWGKLNKFEKWMTTVIQRYRLFKLEMTYKINKLKLYFKNEKVAFPAFTSETATDEDKELLDFLHRTGQDIPPPPVKTVVVEAHIDKHAEGKIVKELWGQDIELMDNVKIKAYHIVPNVNPYDDADEKEPEKMGSWDHKAHFVHEGAMPIEE